MLNAFLGSKGKGVTDTCNGFWGVALHCFRLHCMPLLSIALRCIAPSLRGPRGRSHPRETISWGSEGAGATFRAILIIGPCVDAAVRQGCCNFGTKVATLLAATYATLLDTTPSFNKDPYQ